MAVYDVELLSVPAHVPLESASVILGVSEAHASELLEQLPVVVAERVDESEAETLFHELMDLGAKVTLRPVVGAPSRRPASVRPASAPLSAPPAPSASAIPPAAAVPLVDGRPPRRAARPVEPIDLDDFDLPGLDEGLELEPPSVGGSWHPPAGSPELADPTPGSWRPPSTPPRPDPVDVRHPLSAPPSSAPSHARPPLSAPPSQPAPSGGIPMAMDSGVPVPEGHFLTDILWAYLYPLRPPVLGVALAAAIPILLLSLPKGSLFGIGLVVTFMFTLLKLGITGVFAFWLMRHAYLGRAGALPQSSEVSRAEPLTDKGMRILLICLPVAIVGLFGSSPWREVFLLAWTLYLPAAFILAFFGSGWLGGMNVVGGVRLILRVPGPYAVLFLASLPLFAVAFLTFFLVGGGSTLAIMSWSGAVYLLTGLVAVVYMLSVAALARLLGRFMLRYEDDIGLV